MSFEDFLAAAEVVEQRHALARQVRDALDLAGLPTHLGDGYPLPPGARIEVDGGKDEMGGVLIVWQPGSVLAEAIVAGREESLFLSITEAMRDTMVTILHASGFDAVPLNDLTHHPPMVQVRGTR